MAIAFVAERLAAGVSLSGGSFQLASNSTQGNHLILMIQQGNNGALTAISDSKGNTWSIDVAAASSNNASISIASCYLASAILTTDTITVTGFVDGGISPQVVEFSGLATASWADQPASNSGSTTSLTSGTTGTTAQADELVIASFGFSSSPSSFTQGAGYSKFPTDNAGALWLACEYKIVSAIGTQTADGTAGSATNWWGGVATYKSGVAASPAALSIPEHRRFGPF